MARVNIDSKVWSDPRVKRLARLCGWGMPQTVGTLAAVWNVAYEAKDPNVAPLDIDTAAERDGFSEMLTRSEVNLGELRGETVFLRGVLKRIRYLLEQAERGRKGGTARTATAQRTPNGRLANAKQVPSERLANAEQCLALPPDLDLPPDLPPAPDPALDQEHRVSAQAPPVRVSRKKKQGDHTAAELASVSVVLAKLSAASGIEYRGGAKHTALIVARLRDGVTEWDLRRVIGYCSIGPPGWREKPNMRPYLRPETLFGPEAIERYLDAARAWEPSPEPPEARDARPAPQLELVPPVRDEHPDPLEQDEAARWAEPEWMTQ